MAWDQSSPQHSQNLQPDQQQLTAALKQQYFSNYSLSWITFINSIHLTPFTSLQDAANQLAYLSKPDSPSNMKLTTLFSTNLAHIDSNNFSTISA